ncbi:MAG TPA: thiamine pyrophosphate-binding protein, partial [Clostridia bacterium]|nr:thiamine pyrophosphate-binding protein [Clostridia bacterium]
MTVWEAVVKALKAEGVRYIFGLPGNPSFLYDALHDVPEIKPIHVREESSGGFMAMCYARAGYAEGIATPGVCFASPGPGMANLIPALLEAESACLPVLAIVASESTEISGKGAFQEADQISMARPVTKWTVNITDPVKAPWAIRRAFSLMVNGRPGPVMVQIPANVGLQDAGIPEYVPAGPRIRTEADPFLVSRAVDLLLSAKRPVMVVGGGAVSSGAFEEVREICDLLGMPVLTTPCGRGCVSEDFPLALGLVGLYFTRLGEEIYSDADLLFVVGSRNEEMQSGGWKFFPKNARYVQVDIDASQIGLNWIPDVGLVGDAKLVLRQIIRAVTESDAIGQLDRTRAIEIADAKARFEAEIDKECIDESVPLKSKRIVHAIGEVFGPDTIIVKENGSQ